VHVRWLRLVAFRNHASLSFAPDPGLNVLVGANGHGKTSLLEAFHVILTGRSFRTARLRECVAWGASEARLSAGVERAGQSQEGRLVLSPRPDGGLATEGARVRWARAVSFSAADLGLLTGFPSVRRAYLDGVAAKLAPAHGETCRRYRLVLHHRGRLLTRLAGRADAARLLTPWDEQAAALGSEIVHRRLATLEALRNDAREVWGALAPDGRTLELAYAAGVAPGPDPEGTRERLLAALAAGRGQELGHGTTPVGPHRDDLLVRLDGVDARTYASRGEQRLLALALRLAEAGPVRRESGSAPVLLLDDLLSELDLGARGRVLTWLAGQGQVVFSATDGAGPTGIGVTWEVRRGGVAGMDAGLVGSAA